jgi:hypothetical protein
MEVLICIEDCENACGSAWSAREGMYTAIACRGAHLPIEIAEYTRSEDRRRPPYAEYNCPGYTDLEEMYRNEKLDGVIIYLPPQLHADYAIDALTTGCTFLWKKRPRRMMSDVRKHHRREGDRVVCVASKAFGTFSVKRASCKLPEIRRYQDDAGLVSDIASP